MEDPIVLAVIERIKERSAVGIAKYGTTLARDDLSTIEWLNHLQEELMDAINYIEALKSMMVRDDLGEADEGKPVSHQDCNIRYKLQQP